jgi:hypothetical protein
VMKTEITGDDKPESVAPMISRSVRRYQKFVPHSDFGIDLYARIRFGSIEVLS